WIVCAEDPYATCNSQSCAAVVGCDSDPCSCEIGTGTVETPDGTDCGVVGGQRYLTEAQSSAGTSVKQACGCMAEVGTNGSGSERQMDATLGAVSDALNAPTGCNSGFVRDDSILVVTVITDEDDAASAGNPAQWKSSLAAVKNNDEAGVVVLGLIGDLNQPNAVCTGDASSSGADNATTLRQFVTSMDNHVLGSVCEPNYNSFFEQAVQLI